MKFREIVEYGKIEIPRKFIPSNQRKHDLFRNVP